MTTRGISEEALLAQEASFARAFAAGDPAVARDLYQPDVVYVSPTVRLFEWPDRIDGIERTLEFIALTIRGCPDIRYEAVERAITPTRTRRSCVSNSIGPRARNACARPTW
jgi:hypothetical protein